MLHERSRSVLALIRLMSSPLAFRVAGSAAFALLLLTTAAGAQSTPQPQRGSTPAAQGQQRSTSPAPQPSSQQRSTAPAAQPSSQQKGNAAQQRPQQKNGAAGSTSGAAKPAAPAPGGGQAKLLDTFDDWGAYATQSGRAKVCYALSQPKDRLPKNLSRDPGYLFVSFRPAENVRNEVALVMGFGTKDGGPAEATIGTSSYDLITKGQNAWVKNPAEEGQVIAAMSRGQTLTVKATSARGNETTDRYSLKGFGKALEKARDECK
jgi:hypothetical protein